MLYLECILIGIAKSCKFSCERMSIYDIMLIVIWSVEVDIN